MSMSKKKDAKKMKQGEEVVEHPKHYKPRVS